jgi:hypothetical protein
MDGINTVKNWSWEFPTTPGIYLVCFGDVETPENVAPIVLQEVAGRMFASGGPKNYPLTGFIEEYQGCKFARLVFRGTEIKEIEGR